MVVEVDDGPVRTFGNISLAGQSLGNGVLTLSKAGFAWRARDSGRQVSVSAAEMVSLQWLRGGRGQQICIRLKGGSSLRFEGFRDSDHSGLEDFFSSSFGMKLERGKQALRGWSWGQVEFVSGGAPALVFNSGGGTNVKNNAKDLEEAFEISIGTVGNVQLPNKNELALDVNVDDTLGKLDEELVELRFYIPDEDDADKLLNNIKARADTSAFAGETICSFNEVGISVPRGRFEVDMFPNHIKLHGKSTDFKILYSSIKRLFLLPKPDEVLVSFVMSLEPPIRQGNTMYPHIVFQFDTEQRLDVDLAISDDDLSKRYNGKLAKRESGESWRVFSKIMKHLSKSPLHVPKNFRTSKDSYAVRTALGANEGFLFFLESCCFFVNKPPTYVRYEDIDLIEFKRLDLERRFDLSMQLSGSSTLLFTNIERTEFELIFKFLESKDVPIDNADVLRRSGGRAGQGMVVDDDVDSESDDEDFDPTAVAANDGDVNVDVPAAGNGRQDEKDDDEDEDEDEEDEEDDELDEGAEVGIGKNEVLDLVNDQDDPEPRRKKKKTK